MMTAQLLSIPEAAARKGITRISMWQWVQEGYIPATRLGRFWYIDPADLDRVEIRRVGRHRKEGSCAHQKERSCA
jgi:excisionase family DNA binding protein